MKKTMKVGPIMRPREKKSNYNIVRERINKMKVGDFFKITDIDTDTVNRIRVSVNYFAKQDNFKVSTAVKDNVMTIERVRRPRRTNSK